MTIELLTGCEEDMKITSALLNDAQKMFQDTKIQCQLKKSEFEVRRRSRLEEIAALGKAKDLLAKDPSAQLMETESIIQIPILIFVSNSEFIGSFPFLFHRFFPVFFFC